MKLISLWAVLLLGGQAYAAGNGGASVPWPWPWAEECPIDFESLNGTYVVRQSEDVDFIQISSYWDKTRYSRYLSIQLYNQDFEVLSRGETYIWGHERSIYIPMTSADTLKHMRGLRLQIYHRSQKRSCDAKELIPILTVSEPGEPSSKDADQMVLEPMANWDEESP